MVQFQFIVQREPRECGHHEVTYGAIREVVGEYRASVVVIFELQSVPGVSERVPRERGRYAESVHFQKSPPGGYRSSVVVIIAVGG